VKGAPGGQARDFVEEWEEMAVHRAPRETAVQLHCIAGGRAAEPRFDVDAQAERDARAAMGAWGELGDALWPAWLGMPGSELGVYDALGEQVGQKLLVLWAISRFRDTDVAGLALAELVDEHGRPRFGDPLVEDMMLAAFALGAAWATGPVPAPD
jgi:hypothetical protein